MNSSSPKILVVDDEPLITQSLCEALETMGYRPGAVFNGQQALAEVERDRPDLIVLDILMPFMDGWQVLKAVRENPATTQIPVIVLTALDAEKDMLQGMRMGSTMYITKPVEIAKLTALVNAILGPRRAPGVDGGVMPPRISQV